MPIDVSEPYSAGWWAHRLARALESRRSRFDGLSARVRGDPPLPEGPENVREAYRRFQKRARTNYGKLIVAATAERMRVTGFRTGAEGDENGDREARRIWSANRMAVTSADIHQMMLTFGESYGIVGGVVPETGYPLITAEDPRQVLTAHDPADGRVRAAIKKFRDEEQGRELVYVYLPGEVHVAFRDSTSRQAVRFNPRSWEWDPGMSGPLPHDQVPVVRFANEDLAGEFEPHVDLLDRINFMVLQRMVVAAMQAFRQRAVKGVPTYDADGREIDYNAIFEADPGALWMLPAGAEMWESGQADLTPMLTSVRHDVQDLAAVTRTPMHYLEPSGENQSAEGASLSREGLIFKTEDRVERVKPQWSRLMSLAFRAMGDQQRAAIMSLETMMAPAERHSLSERYDAGLKAKAQGVPWHTRMSDILQFGPDAVARMESERVDDLLMEPASGEPEDARVPSGQGVL